MSVAIRFDYSMLRGKIKGKFHTESAFAIELGISTVSLSKRLNNQIGFDSTEMHRSCELLGIPLEETLHTSLQN